jgi:hypothetical protein
MQVNNNITVTGRIKLELFDESGKLKDTRETKNLVVTAGKNYLAAWIAAASQAGYFMQYIGLGEGSSPAQSTDTDLETPLASRVAGAVTSSGNVWQNVASFGPGVNTGTITEAGLFSASVAGTMFAHQVFGAITKSAGDSLQVTWQVTIS